MKKFIFILNAIGVMDKLLDSKRVEGVLFVDENTGRLTFKAYNRLSRQRAKERMVKKLPWGWVKESIQRIKVYTSLPKQLDTLGLMEQLGENTRAAEKALVERELESFL